MKTKSSPEALLVVSHVPHFKRGDSIYAYTPYACEIDIWADLFPRVIIAAPCREERPPDDTTAFTRSNISILPQKETGGTTIFAKMVQLMNLPALVWNLGRAMRRVDAIHVRCPGNLGLLGAVLAPLFSPYLVAKYAGQWNRYPGEPWTVRLQKMILRSSWWRGPVTVYGEWPDQPSNVVPFFTTAMTANQLLRAQATARKKEFGSLLRVLYVGRLSASKNVDVLLSAIAALSSQQVRIEATIVGDGPERLALEAQATRLGLQDKTKFTGAVELEKVLDCYQMADVLVLISETEGWPKTIAEAMAFGLVCIGSDRGLVPRMLAEGRGIVVPPRDVGALIKVLQGITVSPQRYQAMSAEAAVWAQGYSLESLREALRNLLSSRWGVVFDNCNHNPGVQGRSDLSRLTV